MLYLEKVFKFNSYQSAVICLFCRHLLGQFRHFVNNSQVSQNFIRGRKSVPMTEDKKVQWHPAFYGAMHLELKENKEDLGFKEELILNTLPLRVDMLVVKKKTPCDIQNEIGRMFRIHNLLEYKSPDDVLNYNVFLKGIAYVYLYKARETYVDEILLEEITLTFIRERKPVKLFKRLRKENFFIEEKETGIYYIIKEGYINMQVVVTKELSRENHIWLNSLAKHIDEEHITELISTTQALEYNDERYYADSLWEVVATVNKSIIEKVREDETMCRALAQIMKPEIDEAFDNGFNNGINDGKQLVFRNMIKDGVPRELAQKYAEISDQLADQILTEG